jgi:hypothetical protein
MTNKKLKTKPENGHKRVVKDSIQPVRFTQRELRVLKKLAWPKQSISEWIRESIRQRVNREYRKEFSA